MSDGGTRARSSAAWAASVPRATAGVARSAPPYLPIGVRTALRIATRRGGTGTSSNTPAPIKRLAAPSRTPPAPARDRVGSVLFDPGREEEASLALPVGHRELQLEGVLVPHVERDVRAGADRLHHAREEIQRVHALHRLFRLQLAQAVLRELEVDPVGLPFGVHGEALGVEGEGHVVGDRLARPDPLPQVVHLHDGHPRGRHVRDLGVGDPRRVHDGHVTGELADLDHEAVLAPSYCRSRMSPGFESRRTSFTFSTSTPISVGSPVNSSNALLLSLRTSIATWDGSTAFTSMPSFETESLTSETRVEMTSVTSRSTSMRMRALNIGASGRVHGGAC